MTFQEAMHHLTRNENHLVWCPEYSQSKWDKKAIDFLTSQDKKGLFKNYQWLVYEEDVKVFKLTLPVAAMKLIHVFNVSDKFKHKYEYLNYKLHPNHYGTFFLGGTIIQVSFEGEKCSFEKESK